MTQQNKRLCLQQAFESTTYRLQYNSEKYFDIQFHQENPQFDKWLEQEQIKSWALITPFNPNAELHSEKFNQQQWRQLKYELKQQQLTFYAAINIAETISASNSEKSWPDEPGFFIANIKKDHALSIAIKFNQQAFVFGQNKCELIWCC